MNDPSQWLKTRQRLLRQIKSQVNELLGFDNTELESYGKDYHSEFQKEWKPCKTQDLITSMIQTQLVLGGDFHAYSQSQRSHLRLLRSLPPGLKVTVALECFDSSDQEFLDRFLAGEISEKDLLSLTRWDEKWGFPWEHYRPLIQLALHKGFKVRGLNRFYEERTLGTLKLRDTHSAEVIRQIRESHPEDIIYCLYGDLHIADEHLPQALRTAFGEAELPMTIIFQDSETLYFELAHQGLENKVEAMQGGEDKFCIIGSPPWVKWQSYLIYLEHTFDQDLEEDDDDGNFDFTDHLHALVQILLTDLKLEVDVSELAVYTASDDVPITQEDLSDDKIDLLQELIARERNFYLVEKSILYLSRFSTNHAASLAGMFVHFQLMNLKKLPLDFPKDFTRFIWLEAISFFFSKWVNHKRKPESLRELKARFAAIGESSPVGDREPLLLALDQRMVDMLKIVSNTERPLKVSPENPVTYVEAARLLGSILGERIYRSYKGSRLTLSELQEILSFDITGEGFEEFYLEQVRRFESVGSVEGLS